MTQLGERLRAARESMRITQLDLAKRIGVSRAAVSQWEANIRTAGTGHLRKAAEALHVPVADLLGDASAGSAWAEAATAATRMLDMRVTFHEKALVEMFRVLPENVRYFQLAQIAECVAIAQGANAARKKPRVRAKM